jgi:cation diffusion facilitator CzcD-associated flavoprotein CzcO
VAQKYNIYPNISFNKTVTKCDWIESSNRWRIQMRDSNGALLLHECQILFAGTGQLITPRDLDVPGVENFAGPVMHSARWRPDVEIEDKKIVVFGNGCTGTQLVSAVAPKAQSLTHIVRSKHWIFPPIDGMVPPVMHYINKYVPLSYQFQRLLVFLQAELSWPIFTMDKKGAKKRVQTRAFTESYMRSTAPKKYHDLLVPEFEVGCKRRIFDSGYLKVLHRDNVELTNVKAEKIVPEGVHLADGRLVEADVILLANGFQTNNPVAGMDIRGKGGVDIRDHWEEMGGAGAYNTCTNSSFPNFFLILGKSENSRAAAKTNLLPTSPVE